MKTLVENIKTTFDAFAKDAEAQIEKGVKSH